MTALEKFHKTHQGKDIDINLKKLNKPENSPEKIAKELNITIP